MESWLFVALQNMQEDYHTKKHFNSLNCCSPAVKDSVRDVSQEAIRGVSTIVKGSPEISVFDVSEMFFSMLRHNDWVECQGSVCGIFEVVKMFPKEKTSRILAKLSELLKGNNQNIQCEIIRGISKMASRLPPQKFSDVFGMLFLKLGDQENYNVRKEASRDISEIVKTMPREQVCVVYELMCQTFQHDNDPDIRQAAIRCIQTIVRMLPEQKTDGCFQMFFQILHEDESSIRLETIRGISIIIKKFPEKAPVFLQTLFPTLIEMATTIG